MKKLVFFCSLASLFFLTAGCISILAYDAYKKDEAWHDKEVQTMHDVADCVRLASEAGVGIDKPCPFTDRYPFGLHLTDRNATKDDIALLLLQKYNLAPDQRVFVTDCLGQKGYFKPGKPNP
jgi:hypothetical protein